MQVRTSLATMCLLATLAACGDSVAPTAPLNAPPESGDGAETSPDGGELPPDDLPPATSGDGDELDEDGAQGADGEPSLPGDGSDGGEPEPVPEQDAGGAQSEPDAGPSDDGPSYFMTISSPLGTSIELGPDPIPFEYTVGDENGVLDCTFLGCPEVYLLIDGRSNCTMSGADYNNRSSTSPIEARFSLCDDYLGSHTVTVEIRDAEGLRVASAAMNVTTHF